MDSTPRQETRSADQELIDYLDGRLQQITSLQEASRREVTSLREEARRRCEEIDSRLQRLEETDYQALAVIEGLRHEMRLIADGVVVLDDRLGRYHRETSLAFDQIKGEIVPYYKNLNSKLAIVESWADRQHADVMDAVRKMLGCSSLQRLVPSE